MATAKVKHESCEGGLDVFHLGQAPIDGQLCMEGDQLVRHYLQQAQLHAEFLPGGKHHGTVVSDHVITPEEAAAGVREDLQHAMAALQEMQA